MPIEGFTMPDIARPLVVIEQPPFICPDFGNGAIDFFESLSQYRGLSSFEGGRTDGAAFFFGGEFICRPPSATRGIGEWSQHSKAVYRAVPRVAEGIPLRSSFAEAVRKEANVAGRIGCMRRGYRRTQHCCPAMLLREQLLCRSTRRQ